MNCRHIIQTASADVTVTPGEDCPELGNAVRRI